MYSRSSGLNDLSIVRGQSQPEFLIIFSLAVFMVVVLSILYSSWNGAVNLSKNRFRAAELANTAAFAINSVYFAGDGTELNISLSGPSYMSIVVDNRTVTANDSEQVAISQIVVTKLNTSRIALGERRFYNNKGIVEVS